VLEREQSATWVRTHPKIAQLTEDCDEMNLRYQRKKWVLEGYLAKARERRDNALQRQLAKKTGVVRRSWGRRCEN